MKIEEGMFYRTRDGRKVGPIERRSGYNDYVWRVDGLTLTPDFQTTWLADGRFHTAGHFPEFDLVAEWTDESTGPVRTVTRKEIVFGVFGKVMVNEGPTKGTFNSVSMAPTKDPDELRAAAATLNEIADALSEPPHA